MISWNIFLDSLRPELSNDIYSPCGGWPLEKSASEPGVKDNDIIWVWFDHHRYINDPYKKVEKLIFFSKKISKFFSNFFFKNIPMSTIIYYRLLSKYCLLLSYSHYRFHYRNSISTLEGLLWTGLVKFSYISILQDFLEFGARRLKGLIQLN